MFAAATLSARPGASSTGISSSAAAKRVGPGEWEAQVETTVHGDAVERGRVEQIRYCINILNSILDNPRGYVGNKDKKFHIWTGEKTLTPLLRNAITNLKKKMENLILEPTALPNFYFVRTGEKNIVIAKYLLWWFCNTLDGNDDGIDLTSDAKSSDKIIKFGDDITVSLSTRPNKIFWKHDYEDHTSLIQTVINKCTGLFCPRRSGGRRNTRKSKIKRNQRSQRKSRRN